MRFAALALCLLTLPCTAQGIELGDPSLKPPAAQRVTFSPEPVLLQAGKPNWIELNFHVEPGFHVNSHTPNDETLIPTSLRLTASQQYRVLKDSFPPGTPLRLPVGAGETLSTYQGDFRVRLQVVAMQGAGTVAGTLHYQACDAASCFPPRDLPFSVPLSVR